MIEKEINPGHFVRILDEPRVIRDPNGWNGYHEILAEDVVRSEDPESQNWRPLSKVSVLQMDYMSRSDGDAYLEKDTGLYLTPAFDSGLADLTIIKASFAGLVSHADVVENWLWGYYRRPWLHRIRQNKITAARKIALIGVKQELGELPGFVTSDRRGRVASPGN